MGTDGDAAVFDGPSASALTAADKRDIEASKAYARALGYARLSVHCLEASDGINACEIVSAYRAGEPWSTWAFARSAARVVAWSALTGADMGSFPDMQQALRSVLSRVSEVQKPPGRH